MISNQEKLQVVQDRIEALLIHVEALENDILNNPETNHPDKKPKQDVLNEILSSISSLEAEKESLTNQG